MEIKNNLNSELPVFGAHLVEFTCDTNLSNFQVKDVDVLHYRIDDEELLCISDNGSSMISNHFENCDELEGVISNCDYDSDCCSDFEIDDILKNKINRANYRSNDHTIFNNNDKWKNVKCTGDINVIIGDSEASNVDSSYTDGKSRLKNLDSDSYSGPYLSSSKSKPKERVYTCTIGSCKRKFLHIGSFKQHQLLHNSKTFKCKYCDQVFCELHRLKDHEASHFDDKGCMILYRCLVLGCNKEFCSKNLLYKHEKSHLKSSSKPFLCHVCDKHYRSKISFRMHLKQHSMGSYKCLECHKYFVYPLALKNHQKSHLNGKNFICNLCGADFRTSNNYLRHLTVHRSRKYTCNVCTCSFHYKSSMTKHIVKAHPNARIKQLQSPKPVKNIIPWILHLNSYFRCGRKRKY